MCGTGDRWKSGVGRVVIGLLAAALLLPGEVVSAQAPGSVSGRVVDPQELALPGATVELRLPDGTFVTSVVSGRDGGYTLGPVVEGSYRLVVRLQGFDPSDAPVDVVGDVGALDVTLDVGRIRQEVTVSALMPEVATEFVVTDREIARRPPQDLATSLRQESGVNAVRRGPINLEPTIRGLFEAEIAMLVDGTRTFSAGPARMDSDISHVSPHAMQAVRVVKGPYALSWGAGALSAIRVETFKPAFSGGPFVVNGQAGYNFGSNGNANDAFATLYGRSDRVRFTFLHNSRTGDDYTDGAGTTVPGDYESFETRWAFGFRARPDLLVEYDGGYQKQNDLDYPGRLLDATLFETQSHAGTVEYTPEAGLITELVGQVYLNNKDHAMNNDDKPTALDMPGRVPPFGLAVTIDALSDTTGGRFHVGMARGPLSYKLGFDAYHLNQDADRTIARRRNDMVLFEDIVWPDATIQNVGGYGQIVYDSGRTRIGGTVRVDHEQAEAGPVSDFFRENTIGALDRSDTFVSAAANAALRVNDFWLLNLGLGRAVRQPTVLERYSDRFPSTKFQIAAEFMGQPDLKPEQSLELNIGSMFRVAQASIQADVFVRTINDYITVIADPDLPTRLPLSPPVVYRYINGDEARFVGYDVRAETALGPFVDVWGGWTYVWAEDTFFDEPLFGISPFEQRYSARVHTRDGRGWAELLVTSAARQDRVAEARFEQPTDGWTTLDLLAGYQVVRNVTIKLGLENLTNEFYATHVNSLNPFTRERIAEFGRNVYVGAEFGF